MLPQANLLAGLFAFALGVALVFRSRHNPSFRSFFALCMSVSLLCWLGLLQAWSPAPWHYRLVFIAYAALIPSVIGFFHSFPEEPPVPSRAVPVLWQLASLALFLGAVLPQSDFPPLELQIYLGKFLVFLALLRVLRILAKHHHESDSVVRRGRLKILWVGGYVTVLALLIQEIPRVPALGMLAVACFLYLLSQALLYYRLLDLQEILGRGVVFAFQALTLTGVFALVSGLSANREPIQFFLFNALLAASIIVILIEPLRKVAERVTKVLFFRLRYEFERQIQEIRELLPTLVSEEKVVATVLSELRKTGRVTHASLYTLDEDSLSLRCRGQFGSEPAPPQLLGPDRGLAHLLDRGAKPLLLENLERQIAANPGAERESQLLSLLSTLDARVCLPLLTTSGQFMGVLNLSDRGFDEAYSTSELRLLMTLAGQLATVLRNLRQYTRIVDQERLMALGEMAAGLAHEIRNPLGAIRGAAQYLSTQQGLNGENKFLSIIMQETDRLNRVLEQFLDFAHGEQLSFAPASLPMLLQHTLGLLQANGLPSGVNIELQVSESLPLVTVDPERMKQVFLNLAKNGLEALPAGGTLFIEAAVLDSGHVELVFSDTGQGLKDADPNKVFAPFYTTKEKGSGLGLAICQRIILDHGATIEAERRGRHGGASFRIRLAPNGPLRVAAR